MCNINSDDKAIKTVQEARSDYIAGKKSPERVEDDPKAPGTLPLLVQPFRRKGTIAVILFNELVDNGISIMEKISFQVTDARPFSRQQSLMDQVPTPGRFFPVGDP